MTAAMEARTRSWRTRNSSDSISIRFENESVECVYGQTDGRPQDSATVAKLLSMADALVREERLLAAARVLNQVNDASRLKPHHLQLLELAQDCSDSTADLMDDLDDGWIRQGESHGKHDTRIAYKIGPNSRLTCRIETPIEQSLLVPLLSVLNEVDLYQDWIPSFNVPRFGIRRSRVLKETGHRQCNKILQVLCDVAWPFNPREALLRATAVDDIDESGFILVRLRTLPIGADGVVPPPARNVTRVDFEGAFLFRSCPKDHPVLKQSKKKYTEPLILVTFKLFCDSKMRGVPMSIVNFVTRTAIGNMWSMLLEVADGVRNKKRPAHEREIASKTDFYAWVASRIDKMLAKLEYSKFVNYLQG